MAKNKIQRIDLEIQKTREKIAEQQEKLKALEAQKTEAENLEIVREPGDRPDGARPAYDPGTAFHFTDRRLHSKGSRYHGG